MYKYTYSVVKFVPSPIRGEAINVGIIVGSDETGEWKFNAFNQEGRRRAKWLDDKNVFPNVAAELERIDSWVNAGTLKFGDDVGPCEKWLASTASHSRNVLQFSPPRPSVADSAEEVMARLWPQFIVEPLPQHRDGATKTTVVLKYHRAIEKYISRDHVKFDTPLETGGSKAAIDVSVHNGVVKELTQCWSLQLKHKQQLLDSVRAWGFTMRQLRDTGGLLKAPERDIPVPAEVRVSVVYAEPKKKNELIDEVFKVFNSKPIHALPIPLKNSAEHALLSSRLVAEHL